MAGKVNQTSVTGGSIVRNAKTGRFVEVTSRSGTSKGTDTSAEIVREASKKRESALKRLADR